MGRIGPARVSRVRGRIRGAGSLSAGCVSARGVGSRCGRVGADRRRRIGPGGSSRRWRGRWRVPARRCRWSLGRQVGARRRSRICAWRRRRVGAGRRSRICTGRRSRIRVPGSGRGSRRFRLPFDRSGSLRRRGLLLLALVSTGIRTRLLRYAQVAHAFPHNETERRSHRRAPAEPSPPCDVLTSDSRQSIRTPRRNRRRPRWACDRSRRAAGSLPCARRDPPR